MPEKTDDSNVLKLGLIKLLLHDGPCYPQIDETADHAYSLRDPPKSHFSIDSSRSSYSFSEWPKKSRTIVPSPSACYKCVTRLAWPFNNHRARGLIILSTAIRTPSKNQG